MDIIEWCRKNDIWYLKIDLEIPEVCISEAQTVYDEGFFVEHRYGDGGGWESAALYGFTSIIPVSYTHLTLPTICSV